MTIDIRRLPRRTVKAGAQLYRIHRAVHGPWFFDGSGDGRFDPVNSAGRGACYWSESPLGAWVEVFRTRMLLGPDDLTERRLSIATLASDQVVRDLASRRALAAGVTTALTAGADYGPSHALSEDLQGVAAGVRWRVRHDLAQELTGIAWFGPAGSANPSTLASLPPTETNDVPEHLVAEARRLFGYEVLPLPR